MDSSLGKKKKTPNKGRAKRVSKRTLTKTARYSPTEYFEPEIQRPLEDCKKQTKKQKIEQKIAPLECVICRSDNDLPVDACSNENCTVSLCLDCLMKGNGIKTQTSLRYPLPGPVFKCELPKDSNKCPLCRSPFRDKLRLMNRLHYDLLQRSRTVFTCPSKKCKHRTGQLWDLAKHLRDDHGALDGGTNCPFCGLSLPSSAVQAHITDDCKCLGCPVTNCLRRNLTHAQLLEHLEEHKTIKARYTKLWLAMNNILRNALYAIRHPHLHARAREQICDLTRNLGVSVDLESFAGSLTGDLQAGLPHFGVVDASGALLPNPSQTLDLQSAGDLFASMSAKIPKGRPRYRTLKRLTSDSVAPQSASSSAPCALQSLSPEEQAAIEGLKIKEPLDLTCIDDEEKDDTYIDEEGDDAHSSSSEDEEDA